MRRTNEELKRAAVYSLSGGFLAVVFGVLGAAAAQAAPGRAGLDGAAGAQARVAAAAPPPPTMEDQNDRKLRAIEDGKRQEDEKKRDDTYKKRFPNGEKGGSSADWKDTRPGDFGEQQAQKDRREEQRNKDSEEKRTDTYNKRFPNGEKGGSSADWKDTRDGDFGERQEEKARREETRKSEERKREDTSKTEDDKADEEKRDDTHKKRFPNGEKGGSSADWKDTRPGDFGEQQAEKDRREQVRQDQEAAKTSSAPVKGTRVIDYEWEVDQATDAAVARADHLAKERDKGPVGSVTAWEATSRLADEAEVEAEKWKKFRGPTVKWLPVPEKKRPEIRRGPQPMPVPVQGMRAFEVGQEISAAVDPTKNKAEGLKELRDAAPAGSRARALFAEDFKQANREAAWLEYVDEAGTPVTQKIASSAWDDFTTWWKSVPAVVDEGIDVGLGWKTGKTEQAYRDATQVAHTAADDLTEFKENVKNPDGSIPPEHRTELAERRAALANATNSATDAYHAKVRMDKFKKRAGGAVSTSVTLGGIAADKIVEGKADGEAIFGALGGEAGSMAGGAIPGPLKPVGSFVGGFVGSAVGEESYKAIRDSGKDIDDIVKDAEGA